MAAFKTNAARDSLEVLTTDAMREVCEAPPA